MPRRRVGVNGSISMGYIVPTSLLEWDIEPYYTILSYRNKLLPKSEPNFLVPGKLRLNLLVPVCT